MKISIIIPARIESKRLPRKPLVEINGKSLLQRVYENAQKSTKYIGHDVDVDIVISTDSEEIKSHSNTLGAKCVLTSKDCRNGTERVYETIKKKLDYTPDFIVNLQGDNPGAPPWFIAELISEFVSNQQNSVITPYIQLSWKELGDVVLNKMLSPFSGTYVILDNNNNAIWFSKNLIPAIRNAKREVEPSPVCRHIGIYGYTVQALETFFSLKEDQYEKLEGLEQLRFLANGINIKMVKVSYKGYTQFSGIDSKEDLKRFEKILDQQGEF